MAHFGGKSYTGLGSSSGKYFPGGGKTVKASSLNRGDYIRDPGNKRRIMIVITAGSPILARGLDKEDLEKHLFISADDMVEKVTSPLRDTSVGLRSGEGQ